MYSFQYLIPFLIRLTELRSEFPRSLARRNVEQVMAGLGSSNRFLGLIQGVLDFAVQSFE